MKERALRFEGLKKYFVFRFPQRPGALRDFLELLGPDDDIARFEYLKKSARNFGSVLIGIETKDRKNFEVLARRFHEAGWAYQDITDNVRLVSLTNYNHLERDTLSDFGGAPFEILVQNTVGKINSFAEDLHLEGETDGGINWLLGAYYANDRIIDSNVTLLNDNANVTAIRALGINGNPALGWLRVEPGDKP